MSVIRFLTSGLPIDGKYIIDVGCGRGHLAKALTDKGARVTGIDPAPAAIVAARITEPRAIFEVAAAEALPFPDGSFNAAVFLNSLHHICCSHMNEALSEAARVTGRSGIIAIIEPLAEGSFFDVFRLIDDESEVRAKAQKALVTAVRDGHLYPLRSTILVRSERFATFEKFVERAVSAAPERQDIVASQFSAIERAFLSSARKRCGEFQLDQPLKADLYACSGAAAV